MLKAELEKEVNRLRFLLMNAESAFDFLSDEQKREIDSIFNSMYVDTKPESRFSAIGAIAGYIMRGQL
ncbi:hypothetical protein DS608_21660 [Salmonella enterica subsp. enterica serovar Javiana]|nr:hypothetical protein [Salmonella enterica subsp. enterica serovar Javiana]